MLSNEDVLEFIKNSEWAKRRDSELEWLKRRYEDLYPRFNAVQRQMNDVHAYNYGGGKEFLSEAVNSIKEIHSMLIDIIEKNSKYNPLTGKSKKKVRKHMRKIATKTNKLAKGN